MIPGRERRGDGRCRRHISTKGDAITRKLLGRGCYFKSDALQRMKIGHERMLPPQEESLGVFFAVERVSFACDLRGESRHFVLQIF